MIRNLLTLIAFTISTLLPGIGFAQWFEADSVFTWKLIETANIDSLSTLQFIPRSDVTPTNWDFGDGATSNVTLPIHTYSYTSWDDSVDVTLSYTTNGQSLIYTRSIPVSPAFFFISSDRNLGQLATYKKVFINLYGIPNHPDSLGNLRFHWLVDDTPISDNYFDDVNLGQWPNIYYTFTTTGVHQVKLELSNTSSSETAEFTHTIRIQPDLSSGKVPLENIPNVFSPNADGLNDEFTIPSSGTAWFDIRIYSRSGGLIYKTESSIIRWDGKNDKGTDMPEGIYYYVIEDLSRQYQNVKGFVYLFRGEK